MKLGGCDHIENSVPPLVDHSLHFGEILTNSLRVNPDAIVAPQASPRKLRTVSRNFATEIGLEI